MTEIKIDMNNPEFQDDFFGLDKNEQVALIKTLRKIKHMTWPEVYSNVGLKWELILSKRMVTGERIYSFRFSQKYRAVALRQGQFIRLLSLHVDHDSAYK